MLRVTENSQCCTNNTLEAFILEIEQPFNNLNVDMKSLLKKKFKTSFFNESRIAKFLFFLLKKKQHCIKTLQYGKVVTHKNVLFGCVLY